MIRAAVLTVSDRSFRGEREDRSGPAVTRAVEDLPARVVLARIVPDERPLIGEALREMAAGADLVLTTGGTGLAARDVTPEATRDVVEREAPGFGEEMRRRSAEITPRAVLSRGTAGVLGRTLIVNLPGSPEGAVQCLGFLAPAIVHAVDLLGHGRADCAPPGAFPPGGRTTRARGTSEDPS